MNVARARFRMLMVEARYFDTLRLPTDENLSLYVLATFLRDNVPQVDFEFDFADSRNYLGYVRRTRYDLCGIYATTQAWNQARAVAEQMKQAGVPVVVGGPHISSLPESFSGEFQIGCVGPGEFVLQKLVEIYREHGAFAPAALEQVPGVVFHDNGRLHIVAPASCQPQLDYLPSPYKYYLMPDKVRANLISSMGCPHRCFFCSAKVINARLRMYSAECLVDQMASLHRAHGITHFKFLDDNFLASVPRLETLIRLLDQQHLLGTVSLSCTASSRLIDADTADMLQRLRTQHVAIGFESGSAPILEKLKHHAVTLEDHARAVQLLHARGIKISGTFVVGTPGETTADLDATLHLVKSTAIEHASAYFIKPLPGTEFWRQLVAEGRINPKTVDFQSLALTTCGPEWYFNEAVPLAVTARYLRAINRLGLYRTVVHNLGNKLLYQAACRQIGRVLSHGFGGTR